MTVSSGFFNSIKHDRLYDSEQISSIFDGIITDGVYDGFGDSFNVSTNADSDNTVFVDSGRAWFDHTWTVNDSRIVVQLEPPNPMLDRIDAIVIDVDRREEVRANSIIAVTGVAGSPASPPELIKEDLHKQYPIAYITRPAGDDNIIDMDKIENKIGTEVCPRVIGILKALNSDQYYQQLDAEFRKWWDEIRDLIGGDTEDSLLALSNRMDRLEIKLDENTIDEYGRIGNYQVLYTKMMAKALQTGNVSDEIPSVRTVNYNAGSYASSILGYDTNRALLPDGWAVYISTFATFADSGKNAGFQVLLCSPDGVAQTYKSQSFKTPPYNGSNPRQTETFVLNTEFKADSYPASTSVMNLHVNDGPWNSGIRIRGTAIYGTITITEDHLVSFDVHSEDFYNEHPNNSSFKRNNFYVYTTKTRGAFCQDGSRVDMICMQSSSDDDDLPGARGFKITKDGVFTLGKLYATEITHFPGDHTLDVDASSPQYAYACSGSNSPLRMDVDSLIITDTTKNSVGTYCTPYTGSVSTLNMNTKTYNTTSYNYTNAQQKTSTPFEYNPILLYNNNMSFSNDEVFYTVNDLEDGTKDYVLYGSSGIDHFVINPLTNFAVAENKVNAGGTINPTIALGTRYSNRQVGKEHWYFSTASSVSIFG